MVKICASVCSYSRDVVSVHQTVWDHTMRLCETDKQPCVKLKKMIKMMILSVDVSFCWTDTCYRCYSALLRYSDRGPSRSQVQIRDVFLFKVCVCLWYCTASQVECSIKVSVISTLCNDASHPTSPSPTCQSGAWVTCILLGAAGGSKQVRRQDWQTHRQTKQMTLTQPSWMHESRDH